MVMDNLLKSNLKMGKKCNSSDSIPTDMLGFFHTTNHQKRKYPVGGSLPRENALLVPRGNGNSNNHLLQTRYAEDHL